MLMFISGFAVEVSLYDTIVEMNINIKKRYIISTVRTGKFYSGVNIVKIINKYFQVIWTVRPNHENIIDISEPGVWFKWSVV